MPYLWRAHSVRTKPSGHFFLIIGPKYANIKRGAELVIAKMITPCTPVIVASSG